MSITKSYNKQNDTYYAYETQYVYDETKQRKVQKRRCIGKFDPETKEVISTGKRGRPAKDWTEAPTSKSKPKTNTNKALLKRVVSLSSRLEKIQSMIAELTSEFDSVKAEYDEITKQISNNL